MMKLRNKKTGEILGSLGSFIIQNPNHINCEAITKYNSLAELNEEWEDYEEPSKTIWQIKDSGELQDFEEDVFSDGYIESSKSIGNYFNTREEAEKVVEKLKAWKRLKDKGFRFIGKTYETDKRFGSIFYKVDDDTYSEDIIDDLDLLFSGGEE